MHRLAAAEGLRFDQVEKDYIILWLLYGLSRPELGLKGWVFKGGTCLRHCYYPGYRFSEDIDFSCTPESGGLKTVRASLDRAAIWVQETSGIRMRTKVSHTIPGDFQTEILVEYNRGHSRMRGLPCIKVHATFDEPLLTAAVVRPVRPRYSDLPEFEILTYSKKEIVVEKMRALLQQQQKWPRPRDLYDLWFILCRSGTHFTSEEIRPLFVEKCRVRQIQPDVERLTSEHLREWNRRVWEKLLGPLMSAVPDFEVVW
ncbi:MAG: nucleotidyl transferase AbiEii/AbiGii toxin family protein [Candidatus Latescibacteria bacterium]|nr:nucleotidyl transferase AbiEii/AbiGii toxin family protein [Candidatus Latescibacterota bacterium]